MSGLPFSTLSAPAPYTGTLLEVIEIVPAGGTLRLLVRATIGGVRVEFLVTVDGWRSLPSAGLPQPEAEEQ